MHLTLSQRFGCIKETRAISFQGLTSSNCSIIMIATLFDEPRVFLFVWELFLLGGGGVAE